MDFLRLRKERMDSYFSTRERLLKAALQRSVRRAWFAYKER